MSEGAFLFPLMWHQLSDTSTVVQNIGVALLKALSLPAIGMAEIIA
jgi:hypothetical protein